MSASSYPIRDLFQFDSLLGKLVKQAQAISDLHATFLQILPSELIPHCRVGCYDKGVLTLFSDSGSFATQLRYQIPHLLSILRKLPHWAGLCSIQIKVLVEWPKEFMPEKANEADRPIPLSSKSAASLQALANSLKNQPGSEALVNSLKRLAERFQ